MLKSFSSLTFDWRAVEFWSSRSSKLVKYLNCYTHKIDGKYFDFGEERILVTGVETEECLDFGKEWIPVSLS